jgi:hypothetical protein
VAGVQQRRAGHVQSVGVQHALGGPIAEGLDKYMITVVIVYDHHMIVAAAQWGNGVASLVTPVVLTSRSTTAA